MRSSSRGLDAVFEGFEQSMREGWRTRVDFDFAKEKAHFRQCQMLLKATSQERLFRVKKQNELFDKGWAGRQSVIQLGEQLTVVNSQKEMWTNRQMQW